MALSAIILKVLGALVSLISGLSALNFPTRSQGGLTNFGKIVLTALVLGACLSAGAGVLDWLVNEEQTRQQRLAADALRYTTADATVSLTLSVDKTLPALKRQIEKLDKALDYAKAHCRSAGSVETCKDYTIRAVIIDEIRFRSTSSLFPSAKVDPIAFGIMSGLGASVRFYHDKFTPSLNIRKNVIGTMDITRETISGTVLFEYDATRLRWFIDGKVPAEAWKVVGVLSVVDLLGKGITATPYAPGGQVCPKETIEHDCDIHLLALLTATKVEMVVFRFPHRRNIVLLGEDAKDNFGVPYVFQNLPSRLDDFVLQRETD